ncbi:MAG: hypothetical protein C4527_28880 [Candidatus Omnitrophota bacterium]|jgi:hypothetical protein|nr:MAG: hypothetical protein C4527_28880 [Candidatus Omnitrophota bacterium]
MMVYMKSMKVINQEKLNVCFIRISDTDELRPNGGKYMQIRPRTLLHVSLIFTAWVVLIMPNAGADTFPLELKQLKEFSPRTIAPNEEEFIFRTLQSNRIDYQPDASSQSNGAVSDFSSLVKKEPAYKCGTPFKGVVRMGSDEFAFALDSTDLPTYGFNRCHFDLNRNGDLTDDNVLQAASPYSRGTRSAFPRVDLKLNAGEKEIDYSFMLATNVNLQDQGGTTRIRYAYAEVYACAYRIGDVMLNGKKHQIAVLDHNSNGRFDDVYTVNPGNRSSTGVAYPNVGDMLLVDPNPQDQNFRNYFNSVGRREKHYLSNMIAIDGRFYDVQITPAGDQLTLTPSDAPIGSIVNPNIHYDAVVYGDQGLLKISGVKDEKVALPVGEWRLLEYVIDADDPKTSSGRQNARSGTYVTARGTSACPAIIVSKDKLVDFPFGPPYKPSVTFSGGRQESGDRPQTVRLGMSLIGSAGETCSDLYVNGSRPPDPSFVIATPSNKIIERGKFEYG